MNNDDKHFTVQIHGVFVHFYFNPHNNLVGSRNYLDLKLGDLDSELAEGHRVGSGKALLDPGSLLLKILCLLVQCVQVSAGR